MNFTVIDMNKWERRAYFEHYMNEIRCTFSITANLNITKLLPVLRAKGFKLYPAFLYMVTKTVNAHREFRVCFNEEGELGYWEKMLPSFTFFHKDDKTFSDLWTDFSNDFGVFHQNYLDDMNTYGEVKGLSVKGNEPPNTINVSSIPWVSFTGFNLNVYTDGRYLLPIMTCGKYFEQAGEILLPVSLQVHHAVCDGYHASIFINELQEMANHCEQWLLPGPDAS
ncbi:chloramphenicol O-acetyltransferase type A [Paenibacillus tianmuensis]|uniref:Chloramphenicol acetyltransferase n=1 Tax=Paenibacillus tianmuensis TaxID=624147 RepID=A0A1G4TZG9_9BACL|nr:type A chloramphenicol O-acetyltransferase [Paenibacillus tianmuensis]SCW86065.1 chloramphenicol O-acetyltransferase type A [Paenibacillus tianmuensis]